MHTNIHTVDEADKVSKMLIDEGFTVSTLHGRIESADRDSIMDAFRRGETKFLVTTDVLSRGVDVPAVSVVVNYTVPRSKLNRDRYLHMQFRFFKCRCVDAAVEECKLKTYLT